LGLQAHRNETFKLSTDAFLLEKLRDVVGLYLKRSENALALCVGEKNQCQALERTQPMLPVGLGYVEGITHDYVRHSATTLFAAMNVLNGGVLLELVPGLIMAVIVPHHAGLGRGFEKCPRGFNAPLSWKWGPWPIPLPKIVTWPYRIRSMEGPP